MNCPENNASASRDNKDAMLLSTQDGKRSCSIRNYDSPSLESRLAKKLPKFALSMKHHFSSNLRILHHLNEDRRQYVLKLNPEYHLKFLEENLSILSKKPSRCIDFKLCSSKSSSLSVETSQKLSSLSQNKLHSFKSTSTLDECVGSVSQGETMQRWFDNGHSNDNIIIHSPKLADSEMTLSKQPMDIRSFEIPPAPKILKRPIFSSKSNQSHKCQSNRSLKSLNDDETIENMKKKNDCDNQFEFTVAEENIVSFVCSPPSSRRRKNESESVVMYDSDEESTFPLSTDISQTTSVTSKNGDSKNINRKCKLPAQGKNIKTNLQLSQMPSTSSLVSQREGKSRYGRSSLNVKLNHTFSESCINFFGSHNSVCTFNKVSDYKSKLHNNHEVIMFRETALRGCYDIEHILKEFSSALPEVEKEVSRTREAIFSAVRLQKDNGSIVSDAALSIADICNSWIKLSAHFERQDFKLFLETNGVDSLILEEFTQWQNISRVFVDKLIHMLKKMEFGKSNRQCEPKSSSGISPGPEMERAPTCSHLELMKETSISTINQHGAAPNPTPTSLDVDNHGKRWKQRRFLSERIDSEKMVLDNRAFRFDIATGGLHQKPIFTHSHKGYPILGQGDNDLNITCDLSRINMEQSYGCPLAQGCASSLSTLPQRQSWHNSGLIDNSLIESNTKLLAVRGEPCKSSVPATNEFCVPFTNPFGVPLNNCFPVNIQQTMPVISPLCNNQFSLFNSNHYQTDSDNCLAKPNPIHCNDFDATGNPTQNSYMKPGHYAPPQKPASSQKTVNNSFPIEDIPAVGIPFMYSAPQPESQKHRNIESQNGCFKTQVQKDDNEDYDTDVTWKSDISIAESCTESVVASKDNVRNLNLSETEPPHLHFLLSDDHSWNDCSVDNSKTNNGDDVSRSLGNSNLDANPSIIVKLHTKSADWLVESFDQMSLESECSSKSSTVRDQIQSEIDQTVQLNSSNESYKEETHVSQFTSAHTTNHVSEHTKDDKMLIKHEGMNQFLRAGGEYLSRKIKNNKKARDSYSITDRKIPTFSSRPDTMVFATSMSNKVTSQLEEILNCIWKTQVSSLIEDELRSEKERAKLELRVRSPLYFQALRCKLSNRSYDTLDQALSDIHQYFVDIRSRNKGDKICSDAVDGLERIFFDQVENYFGLTYQSLPRNSCQSSETATNKARRSKKTSRKF